MAKLNSFGIDSLDDVQEDTGGGYTAMPAGVYNATVADVELKDTKAGTGQYLSVKFDILDEPYDRRKVWSNLNIVNPSEKAQAIGRAQLKGLAISAGIENLEDTDELIGAMVRLILAIDKDDETRNVVKGFIGSKDEAPAAPVAKPAAKPVAKAAPAAAAKPWQK